MPETEPESGMEKALGKRIGPFNVWEYIAIGSVGLFVFVKIKGKSQPAPNVGAIGAPIDTGSGGYGYSSPAIPPVSVPASTPASTDPANAPGATDQGTPFPSNSAYGGNGAVQATQLGRNNSLGAGVQSFLNSNLNPQPTSAPPVLPLGPTFNPTPTLVPNFLGTPLGPGQSIVNGELMTADPGLAGSAQGAIANAMALGLTIPAPYPTTFYNPSYGAPGGSNMYIVPAGGVVPIGVGNQTTVNNAIAQTQFNQNYQYQYAAAMANATPAYDPRKSPPQASTDLASTGFGWGE